MHALARQAKARQCCGEYRKKPHFVPKKPSVLAQNVPKKPVLKCTKKNPKVYHNPPPLGGGYIFRGCKGVFLVHFRGFFGIWWGFLWYILGGFWYIPGGLLVHSGRFVGAFLGVLWYIFWEVSIIVQTRLFSKLPGSTPYMNEPASKLTSHHTKPCQALPCMVQRNEVSECTFV